MGASYVYKRFSSLDTAITPFNAHKQYNFSSASAASNQVKHFNTSYTSESVSIWSGNSGSNDTINNIKYNQLDHLFYRNHLKNFGTKKDPIHYLKQQRVLYEKANILSIPVGLYGAEIRKNSFYLKTNNKEIIDDGYGNLIISGTNTSNYPNDPQQNVFRLDPIKAHKKYDLRVWDDYAVVEVASYGSHTNLTKKFYRQGLINPDAGMYYTSDNQKYPLAYYSSDEDDSYFFNELSYNNMIFEKNPTINVGGSSNYMLNPRLWFTSATSSYIESPHNPRFNFNHSQDYAISFWFVPEQTGSGVDLYSNTEKRYIISKSTTKTQITSVIGVDTESTSSLKEYTNAGPQYPFEIYHVSTSLYFKRSDGNIESTVRAEVTGSGGTFGGGWVVCQVTGSTMEMHFNGTKVSSTTSNLISPIRNKANLWIGSKGKPNTSMLDDTGVSNNRTYNGGLSHINIYSRAFNQTQIANMSESINNSPYIGNIFYQSGFATITHPKYGNLLSGSTGVGTIDTLQFQGSHLIFEHEYQCTVQEHEYNFTTNTSALNQSSKNPYLFEGFVSSSYFKPHVTTIGLYNDAYELLAVAKLGQPLKMSDETDTTFIVRFDE